MAVDRVADWREWPDGWHGEHSNQGEIEEDICGGFGHSQWIATRARTKGKLSARTVGEEEFAWDASGVGQKGSTGRDELYEG